VGHWFNPPPPQPAAVHVPPNAAVANTAVGIVQVVTTDTAPSAVGSLGGSGGGAYLCVASPIGFTAGNYLLGIGGTPNFAGTRAVKFTDPVNGDWTALEHLNCASAPGGVTDGLDVLFATIQVASNIAPGFVGTVSASGAGTATILRFDGTAPNLSAFVGATFLEYRNSTTGTVTSVTGASSNVLNFTGGGTATVGNPMVVGGFVKFVNTSAGEDFTAATVVEVTGTNGIVNLGTGHSSNQNTYTAAATVSTGTVSPWTVTGLAISFAMDDNDDGTSPFNPLSATGTDDGVLWKWSLASAIMRMQHAVVSSPGSPYGMNFTTQTGDHHQSYLAVFGAAPIAPPIPIPRLRVDLLSEIRSTWLQESWTSQVLIGGGVGALTAPVFTPPVALAAANPALLAAIRQAWPPEQWAAQHAAQIASLLAAAVNPPVAYPSPPASLSSLRGNWPQESWYAQSESGIASGLAQIQLPSLYQPWSITARTALLRSLWLPEDWPSQAGARYAAWIPLPATPLPAAIRHPEILLWTADTWSAQPGTRAASILAGVPARLPYVNRWLSAALRSTWLPEDWPAQTFPDIAGGQSPLSPPLPRPPSQFTISLWPVELWGAQPGTRAASILAGVQIITLMPNVVGELQNIAIAQLQSLFQAVITLQYVFSGAPPETVVAQSIPPKTLVMPGTPVTLQISLGIQRGPVPIRVVESILVSNIPIIVSILPGNTQVLN
jgi:hypothetical protein